MRFKLPSWFAFFAPLAAVLLVACGGCKTAKAPEGNGGTDAGADPGAPTLRLYLLSDVAGALEPCGCTKDQLGGMDHFAALVRAERARAPASALVAAGPLFFMDPTLKGDRKDQDVAKAEAMAGALKTVGFAAFAPAENDWAAGPEELAKLEGASGAELLLANAAQPPATPPSAVSTIKEIGGVKVGFVGVGASGGATKPATEAVRAAVDDLKGKGAQLFVVLASVGRGEAKRIADAVPEVTAIVAGETKASGDQNSDGAPAEKIGDTVVVQTANHLQRVGVLDLYVRDGSFHFADASNLDLAQRKEELTHRIDDLRIKIANWERDNKVSQADLDARRADLARLEKERAALDVQPPPAKGSFFRFATKEIRMSLGSEPEVTAALTAYYKEVNEHNRIAFADRMPPQHGPDQAVYLGVNVCATCHEDAKKFWDGTAHARAYATLADQFKQYNLDCVSCHVTGYEQPGGSTVTHVDKLESVQCEVCHGPGSKHALSRDKNDIVAKPSAQLCTTCHHPPHVEQFDAVAKMDDVVGPGHGRPKK